MFKKYFFFVLMVSMTIFCMIGITTSFVLMVEYFKDTPVPPSIDEQHVSASSVYPYPYVMYKAPPNVDETVAFPTQRNEPVFNQIRTDHNGYRYSDFSKVPAPNSIRGFILGGSVVFLGNTNETTISGFLEQKIKSMVDPSVPVEVINAGFLGAVSEQELALLVHELTDYNPDFIIVFDGYNDLIHPYQNHSSLGLPVHWKEYKELMLDGKEIVERIEHRSTFSNILSSTWFGREVLGAPSFTRTLEDSPDVDSDVPAIVEEFSNHIMVGNTERRFSKEELELIFQYVPTKEQTVHHLLSNWRQMSNIAMMNNMDALLILQPYNAFPIVFNQVNLYEYVREQLAPFTPHKATYKNQQATFHDFAALLRDQKELFWDGVHMYDEGNKVVAQHMFDIIQKENYLPKWIAN